MVGIKLSQASNLAEKCAQIRAFQFCGIILEVILFVEALGFITPKKLGTARRGTFPKKLLSFFVSVASHHRAGPWPGRTCHQAAARR